MVTLLSPDALSRSLEIKDLTCRHNGQHALQFLIDEVRARLSSSWDCRNLQLHTSPAVPVENNYDRLGYPSEGAARDARYTRYISRDLILRTQTSAAIPDLLDGFALCPPDDILLLLPGLVYRRDSIDRLHCGEPHQLDLWRVCYAPMTEIDLQQMVREVMDVLLPGENWKTTPSPHPYTESGVQIDVYWHDDWVEVGECGLIDRNLLKRAGLSTHSGLAMGLGLDRILMIRKNIPDIRLIRSQDPRILSQMADLKPYSPVSFMPPIKRDISICIDNQVDVEVLGDIVRSESSYSESIEELTIKSVTAYSDLPPSAHKRMGMLPNQKNILLQITIRHLEKTLTDKEANIIRNEVYRLLHQGEIEEIASD